MKAKASIAVQINAAYRAIENYERNIQMFESGELTPDIGELTANRLLLARKRKQLRQLECARSVEMAVRSYSL